METVGCGGREGMHRSERPGEEKEQVGITHRKVAGSPGGRHRAAQSSLYPSTGKRAP